MLKRNLQQLKAHVGKLKRADIFPTSKRQPDPTESTDEFAGAEKVFVKKTKLGVSMRVARLQRTASSKKCNLS